MDVYGQVRVLNTRFAKYENYTPDERFTLDDSSMETLLTNIFNDNDAIFAIETRDPTSVLKDLNLNLKDKQYEDIYETNYYKCRWKKKEFLSQERSYIFYPAATTLGEVHNTKHILTLSRLNDDYK